MSSSKRPSRPDLHRAPASNELEISIFGPGKGEAIAVHLGDGAWMTVDSCVDQRTKRHALLEYFGQIAVDPSDAIRLVLGTHAHDDHIAGIADLYEQSHQATFVCSSAITSEEFLRAVALDRSVAAGVRPSIREQYERVFQEARRRRQPGHKPLRRALENLSIWSRQPTSDLPRVNVRCLSPSDEAVTRSLDDLARSVARSVGDRKRFSNRDPNEFAVALRVEYGDYRVLLGADLPIGPAGCGWVGVLDNVPLDGKAGVFKVPHHGSDTAHNDDVWQRLLEPDPVSLIAPFRGGRKNLPSAEDAKRITSLTSRAFITASPHSIARKPGVRQLGSTLSGLASDIRDPWGAVGHVRVRRKPDAPDWTVELFEPARPLAAVY